MGVLGLKSSLHDIILISDQWSNPALGTAYQVQSSHDCCLEDMWVKPYTHQGSKGAHRAGMQVHLQALQMQCIPNAACLASKL